MACRLSPDTVSRRTATTTVIAVAAGFTAAGLSSESRYGFPPDWPRPRSSPSRRGLPLRGLSSESRYGFPPDWPRGLPDGRWDDPWPRGLPEGRAPSEREPPLDLGFERLGPPDLGRPDPLPPLERLGGLLPARRGRCSRPPRLSSAMKNLHKYVDGGPVSWPTIGKNVRRRPTLPPRHQGSTIGAEGLSFRVRNGTGRFPFAIAAETLWRYQSFPTVSREPHSERKAEIYVRVKSSAY